MDHAYKINEDSRIIQWVQGVQIDTATTDVDAEVDKDLIIAYKRISHLKTRIRSQAHTKSVVERELQHLDSRVALLVQNKKALKDDVHELSAKTKDQYGTLFFAIYTEPRYLVSLLPSIPLSESHDFVHLASNVLYPNHDDSREDHVLLLLIQSAMSLHFAETESQALLLGASLLSRLVNAYTRRRPSHDYLHGVLGPRIQSLLGYKDLDLEINPVKICERMNVRVTNDHSDASLGTPRSITPNLEEVDNQSAIQSIIAGRLNTLKELAKLFLKAIIANPGSVPFGVRWICKQLRSLGERKLGKYSDDAIYPLLGRFFIAQLINPALVTPHAYSVIESPPAPRVQNTLILIAKMFQCLAGNRLHSPELLAARADQFFEEIRPIFVAFLDELCRVDDFYDIYEIERHEVLSRESLRLKVASKDLHIVFNIFSQHHDTIKDVFDTPFKTLIRDLLVDSLPSQDGPADTQTIDLDLYGMRSEDAPRSHSTLQNQALLFSVDEYASTGAIYTRTKLLLIQLLLFFPRINADAIADCKAVASRAVETDVPTLVRLGMLAKVTMEDLESRGITEAFDDYEIMQDEIIAERRRLGDPLHLLDSQARALEAVYIACVNSTARLKTQVEQYKTYVKNARLSSYKPKGSRSAIGVLSPGKIKARLQEKRQPSFAPSVFTLVQAEKDGLVVSSRVPEQRRLNMTFTLSCNEPGIFTLALYYKGREKVLMEKSWTIDDLLAKQRDKNAFIDCEYVHLDISKFLTLLTDTFAE
ncbi:Rho GTPase activation protein [Sistotremastrum niveocremeum HHB9708]|uniref:Rho GTPase activation protein n=1 Tax=Sistotremastrum niveocremeum HHB9708 TaxID=1314777 RepID=A0A164NX43_9AGAM|nr:Rho GTPase activation protein [Sistotremastrum niveocremeum HHB9708]